MDFEDLVCRHASVLNFSTSTPTRKRFPHSTVHECLKAFFQHASVFKRTDALSTIALLIKEVQKPFRHASVLKRAFQHARVRLLNPRFRPSKR